MLPTMEDALIVLVVAIVAFACSVVVRVRNTLEQRLQFLSICSRPPEPRLG
jgi:hypothetical protein